MNEILGYLGLGLMLGLAVFKGVQALAAALVFVGVWLVVRSKSRRDMESGKAK